jgi:hypothetical protein
MRFHNRFLSVAFPFFLAAAACGEESTDRAERRADAYSFRLLFAGEDLEYSVPAASVSENPIEQFKELEDQLRRYFNNGVDRMPVRILVSSGDDAVYEITFGIPTHRVPELKEILEGIETAGAADEVPYATCSCEAERDCDCVCVKYWFYCKCNLAC